MPCADFKSVPTCLLSCLEVCISVYLSDLYFCVYVYTPAGLSVKRGQLARDDLALVHFSQFPPLAQPHSSPCVPACLPVAPVNVWVLGQHRSKVRSRSLASGLRVNHSTRGGSRRLAESARNPCDSHWKLRPWGGKGGEDRIRGRGWGVLEVARFSLCVCVCSRLCVVCVWKSPFRRTSLVPCRDHFFPKQRSDKRKI